MGTICILLGLIIFLGSIFGGYVVAGALVNSPMLMMFTWIPTGDAFYAVVIGVIGFIGLLIGLNLVMQGLIYNKVCKIGKKSK